MLLDEFHSTFMSFQNELKSYLLRILGNREDAEDLAHDTYIKASDKLALFKGNASLKTWVFSIATNLTKDHFRGKMRWSVETQDNARDDANRNSELVQRLKDVSDKTDAGKYEIKEHIDFCFTCMSKTLPIEQQIGLILKDIYGFKVNEIMDIMNLSEGKVKHAIANARKTLIDIFDKKCALVSKRGACYQCSELNGILNPRQDQQEQLMRLKMVKAAETGDDPSHLLDLRMALVKNIDPANASGTDLHSYFLRLMPEYSKTVKVT